MDQEQTSWKQKYYESLELVEKREREAAAFEVALRDALARMCVVAEDIDSELDGYLKQLREQLRSGGSSERITQLCRDATARMVLLDSDTSTPRTPTIATALRRALEPLRLPHSCSKKLKVLKKRLAAYKRGDDVTPLIAEFVALMEFARQDASVVGEAGIGRFGSWFGIRTRERNTHAAAYDGSPQSGAELLRVVADSFNLSGEAHNGLQHWLAEVTSATSASEVYRLAQRLATLVDGPARRATEALLSCNEGLLQLLERLEFPVEAQGRLQTLRERLEKPITPDRWQGVLTEVVELIAAVRNRAQREKQELEEFLTQVTEHLDALDKHVRSVESDRSDSLDSARGLDAAVREQVRSIHSSVEQADDLTQLKQNIQERLENIGSHMEQFRDVEERRSDTAQKRIVQLTQRLQSLEGEVVDLHERVGRERRLALLDSLTGTYNRMAYEQRVDEEYERWKRSREPLTLIIIDVDNFKRVNDTYGHKAGDKVLSTIGELLRKRVRASDFLARYGGEEFVILLPGTKTDDAFEVAEQLRKEIARCGFHYRNDGVAITVCCGIASFAASDQPDSVFERADAALYKAKQAGKNCSFLDDGTIDSSADAMEVRSR